MNPLKQLLLAACLLAAASVNAQLAVMVSPPKVVGQKAVVPLALKNDFTQAITSARAAVFVSDERGKVVGQATHWVIGGSQRRPGLASGATNSFHFVITADKPFTATNLTAKVTFMRLVLEGGRAWNVNQGVKIQMASE